MKLRTTLEWRAIAIAAPHIMEILFYFGTFYFAGLAQWMVLKRITNQVNQHLPYSEQYVASIWAFSPRSVRSPINEIKVWRLHRQFFPESCLPWLHLATWVLMIVFFVLCVQFDRSHSIAHPGVGLVFGNHCALNCALEFPPQGEDECNGNIATGIRPAARDAVCEPGYWLEVWGLIWFFTRSVGDGSCFKYSLRSLLSLKRFQVSPNPNSKQLQLPTTSSTNR